MKLALWLASYLMTVSLVIHYFVLFLFNVFAIQKFLHCGRVTGLAEWINSDKTNLVPWFRSDRDTRFLIMALSLHE